MQPYAFFDFDKTIIRGDSLFPYLFYLFKRRNITLFDLLRAGFAGLLYRLKCISAGRAKQMAFSFLRRIKAENLEEVSRDFLKTLTVFEDARQEIAALRAKDVRIVVVSASCDIYLQYLRDILPVHAVICTQIVDGIVQSNCKGEEKTKRIQAYLAANGEVLDAERSYAYGDSKEDLYMMRLVHRRVIVNNHALFAKQHSTLYREVEWK